MAITTCGSLLLELQKEWNEIGESDSERDKMLWQLEQDCLDVYRRQVERSRKYKVDLHQAIAAAEVEITNIVSVLGEKASFPQLEKARGTLLEKISVVNPIVEELRKKKEERMKEFRDVQSQIVRVSAEIAGNIQTCNLNDIHIDEHDLTMKKLGELKLHLQELQKEKSLRLEKVNGHINSLYQLSAVLSMDFTKVMNEVHPSLCDLANSQWRSISNDTLARLAGVGHSLQQEKVRRLQKMSELLNQKSMVQGKVPSGFFNAIFELTGAWMNDANDTKYLAFDGYFISLYYLHLTSSPLILRDEVKKAVPPNWDPASLSRFIQRFGTHIIVGMAVGGQDVICVRQKPSSSIPPAELKAHLEDLGDSWFSDGRISPQIRKKKAPDVFYRVLQASSIQLTNITETSNKDGLAIVCSKRGGNVFLHNHHQWLQTVSSNPDAILFKFVPITTLLSGIPGSGYLSHAINLYLRYKPPTDELEYFLEFQVPRQWAPMYNELPLGPQRQKTNSPSLQFSFMGPKLHINSIQVSSNRKPVLGLRLYLEGKKCNRLAIHIQHLSSAPRMLEYPSSIPVMKPCLWRGSDDVTGPYLEPIKWKRYSNVCTSAVKHDPKWLEENRPGVYVVTGAQLLTKGKWPKNVLHLRLLYSHLPDCSIQKSEWDVAPPSSKNKAGFLTNLSMTFTREVAGPPKQVATAMNSGVYPDGPPVPIHSQKLLKFVDISERSRGPQDSPGHWLVTAAKLVTEGRKIGLHVKFALLSYPNNT